MFQLWEQTYNQKLCSYHGHTKGITHLQLSPGKDEFLSVSEDGLVKIWRIQISSNRNSNGFIYDENGFNQVIPSPRLKQSDHQTFFGNETKIDRSRTFIAEDEDDKLVSASFSNDYENSKLIVTGTQKGKIIVWSVDNGKLFTTRTAFGHPANCVAFSYNDDIVITTSNSYICLFDALDGSFLSQFCNEVPIKALLVVPDDDHCLIAINDSSLTMWTWSQRYQPTSVSHPSMTELYRSNDAGFICGAVTEDGAYLVVASTDHYTRMWNISTRSVVEEFLSKSG